MRKYTLLFVLVICVSYGYSQVRIINTSFINKGIFVSNEPSSTVVSGGAEVINDVDGYWRENNDFVLESGNFQNRGDHRVLGNFNVKTGQEYKLGYVDHANTDQFDDKWGELIVYGSSSGDVKVQKVFYNQPTGDKTKPSIYYMSVPVEGLTIASFMQPDHVFRPGGYNFIWKPDVIDYASIDDVNTPLEVGKTVLLEIGANSLMEYGTLVEVTGPIRTGSFDVKVWTTNVNNAPPPTYDRSTYMGIEAGGNNWDGWSNIGNPFTATLSLEKLMKDVSDGNGPIGLTAYIYRNTVTNEDFSTMATYNYVSGTSSGKKIDAYVLPFESFLIQAKASIIDPDGSPTPEANLPILKLDERKHLTFIDGYDANEQHPNGPLHSNIKSFEILNEFYANPSSPAGPPVDLITIKLYDNGGKAVDYAFVGYIENGNKKRDFYDSTQLQDNDLPYVYSKSLAKDKHDYDYLHNISDDEVGQIIPLVVKLAGNNSLDLKLEYSKTFSNRPIYLEDRATNTFTKIEPNEEVQVSIVKRVTSNLGNRFFLHYGKKPKDVEEKDAEPSINSDLLVNRGKAGKLKVYLSTEEKVMTYSVFTMSGRKLVELSGKQISKMNNRKVNGVDYKVSDLYVSKRYQNKPLIVKVFNDNASYEKIVLPK